MSAEITYVIEKHHEITQADFAAASIFANAGTRDPSDGDFDSTTFAATMKDLLNCSEAAQLKKTWTALK